MTDPRQTTTLATTTANGQSADVETMPIGPNLRTAIIACSDAESRHVRENDDASARDRSRKRSAFRKMWPHAPHTALWLIDQLEQLARENPDASLVEANANALVLMIEAGIGTVRGMLGTLHGAQLTAFSAKQLAEAIRDRDVEKAAKATYGLDRGDAMLDRARAADREIRAEQREQRKLAEWADRSKAITVVAESDSDLSGTFDALAVDIDTTELDNEAAVERARQTVLALQTRKVQAGVFGLNALDDEIKIKPRSKPDPRAAVDGPKLRQADKGTSPWDRDAQLGHKLTPAQLAERGIYSDSVIDPHPLAVAETERQQRIRETREREFETIGRLSGRVVWKGSKPRPMEPAAHEVLTRLRAKNDEPDNGGTS